MQPEFPLRLIWSDGEVDLIEEPEELVDRFPSFDAVEERDRVWIRDAFDRTVDVAIRDGFLIRFHVT
jgi:hypothetical protein